MKLWNWDEGTFGVELGYFAMIIDFFCRVTDIRFSKCSDGGIGNLTQPLDIRHPWLKSRFRQRPVAESLVKCTDH